MTLSSALLKASEIADECRVSTATVHRWRRQGLPAIAVGRMIRFRRADVEAFLDAQSKALTMPGWRVQPPETAPDEDETG